VSPNISNCHEFLSRSIVNVDWDVDRYADRVKLSPPNRDGSATSEPERLKKYFSEAVLGKISTPATIVDRHGRILMVYLPNILSPARLVCFWMGFSLRD
jgi:hypothetical protein